VVDLVLVQKYRVHRTRKEKNELKVGTGGRKIKEGVEGILGN